MTFCLFISKNFHQSQNLVPLYSFSFFASSLLRLHFFSSFPFFLCSLMLQSMSASLRYHSSLLSSPKGGSWIQGVVFDVGLSFPFKEFLSFLFPFLLATFCPFFPFHYFFVQMDGTLTIPILDFAAMRAALGIDAKTDVLAHLS